MTYIYIHCTYIYIYIHIKHIREYMLFLQSLVLVLTLGPWAMYWATLPRLFRCVANTVCLGAKKDTCRHMSLGILHRTRPGLPARGWLFSPQNEQNPTSPSTIQQHYSSILNHSQPEIPPKNSKGLNLCNSSLDVRQTASNVEQCKRRCEALPACQGAQASVVILGSGCCLFLYPSVITVVYIAVENQPYL